MLLGYNTNGFSYHRFEDALIILADLGYESVAITLDHHALNPFQGGDALIHEIERVRKILRERNLRCVIETGARFLLDPRHKHQPTLLSAEESQREQRLDFLRRAVDIAQRLDADAVSFWSGSSLKPEHPEALMSRLVQGVLNLLEYARSRKVRLAFEPEPGMFIDTMQRFGEFFNQLGQVGLGLTVDIGHLHCQQEGPIEAILRLWQQILFNVHLEDMRRGVHEHLMFGDGEIDFPPIFRTLAEIGYQGGVHVELSRHSHDAVETARRAIDFLRQAEGTR
jgi:sugar phosphate isomerase/epimerase